MTRRRLLAWTTVAAPAWGQSVVGARPGLCYWAEGPVRLNGEEVAEDGLQLEYLEPGGTLAANRGRAEVLLGPTTVLRASGLTEVELADADPENVIVRLRYGSILVDVNNRFEKETVTILTPNARTVVSELGVYRFDLRRGKSAVVRVFQGEARVYVDGRKNSIGKGRALRITDGKVLDFDVKRGDRFDKWSQQRRAKLARARDVGLPPRRRRRSRGMRTILP